MREDKKTEEAHSSEVYTRSFVMREDWHMRFVINTQYKNKTMNTKGEGDRGIEKKNTLENNF